MIECIVCKTLVKDKIQFQKHLLDKKHKDVKFPTY